MSESKTTNFNFITYTHPVQAREAIHRSTVRKNAMASSWKKRKTTIPSSHRRPLLPASQNQGPVSLCLCPVPDYRMLNIAVSYCEQCSGKERNDQGSEIDTEISVGSFSASSFTSHPLSRLGNGDRDPFASFIVQGKPYIELLIRHWLIQMAPVLSTLENITKTSDPMKEYFIPLAISSGAMFHSLIAFSSARLDVREGRTTSSARTLLHKSNAIKLLNEALNSVPNATSEAVIAAICLVGGSDISSGDRSNQVRHMEGANQAIALRGGIQSLHTMPCIYWFLIGYDLLRGLFTRTMPRYPIPLTPMPYDMSGIKLGNSEHEAWSERDILSPQFMVLIHHIRNLVQLVETYRGRTNVPTAVINYFRQQQAAIEYRFIELMLAETTGQVEECCLLAAFLYHNITLRQIVDVISNTPQGELLQRLKIALQKTDLNSLWGQELELLLWVSMTASTINVVQTDPWFKDLVKRALKAFVPRPSLTRVKYILGRFLWNESISGPACTRLFEELHCRYAMAREKSRSNLEHEMPRRDMQARRNIIPVHSSH